jgi:uncharacterized integral membrane protein (TIGR00697 family)
MTETPNRTTGHSSWFLLIVALFVTCLIVSNVTAVKLVMVGGLVLPAAVVIFPISYIIGDVLTEVYGFARARQAIWLGFLCNLLAVLAFAIAGALPAAPFWQGDAAFNEILGATPRLLAASFAAYLAGELLNAWTLARLKALTEGRWLWLRTIGSTLVGQLLDSAIFMTIAFAGSMPAEALLGAVVTQWLVKSGFEALATPLTYAAVGFLKRSEGVDGYERGRRFGFPSP